MSTATTSLPPATRVAGITELLENILINLSPKDLFLIQRTSRDFHHLITTSPAIQNVVQNRGLCDRDYMYHPLPIHPAIFIDCVAKPMHGDNSWQLTFYINDGSLADTSQGGTESWRKLLVCKQTTGHVIAMMEVERWETIQQMFERKSNPAQGDEPVNVHDFDVRLDFHLVRKTISSARGITLGDLSDWACTQRDRLKQSIHEWLFSITFCVTVDAEGRPRVFE